MHDVRLARSAIKELQSLPDQAIERIATKIDSLAQQPRPAGCKKLRGSDDLWRVRVGDYRIIYAINEADSVIDIQIIRHRKDAYGSR